MVAFCVFLLWVGVCFIAFMDRKKDKEEEDARRQSG
jgi:hypothetical protein